MKPLLLIALLFGPAVAQAPPVTEQQRVIVSAWSECNASGEEESHLVDELRASFISSPPWRSVDASGEVKRRRRELIDKVIAEHKRRIRLLERIKKADEQ